MLLSQPNDTPPVYPTPFRFSNPPSPAHGSNIEGPNLTDPSCPLRGPLEAIPASQGWGEAWRKQEILGHVGSGFADCFP